MVHFKKFLKYFEGFFEDLYEYEFYFSETPEIVWGEDWNVACPSACGDLKPDPSTYSVIKRLDTFKKFA